MFGKLKDKLKNWTEKFSKKEEENIVEDPTEKTKKEEKVEKKKSVEKKSALKEETKKTETKTLEIPTKFELGTQKVEPDSEKIKELAKELEDETKKIEKLKERMEHPEKDIPDKPLSEKKIPIEDQPKKEGLLRKITSKVSKVKITKKDFDIYSDELEMLLLENNVALEVTEKIIKRLSEKIVEKEFLRKEIEGQIKENLRDIIEEILVEPFDIFKKIEENSPYVILFCGINGTGKTTSIAKMAKQFQDRGKTCAIAAADTFRSASIEQIKKHGEKLGIKVVSHDYGSDPASVGFDAIAYAKKNKIDVVLIDTAGRMHSEKNLLKELEKIVKVCKPQTKIFVGEALTGNDSIEQVRSFDWAIGIDAIILTKADTDEKGGTSLSVGYVTKKPILYLGTGQEYKDLTPFNKQKFIEELGL